jgi:hypothetical protein
MTLPAGRSALRTAGSSAMPEAYAAGGVTVELSPPLVTLNDRAALDDAEGGGPSFFRFLFLQRKRRLHYTRP